MNAPAYIQDYDQFVVGYRKVDYKPTSSVIPRFGLGELLQEIRNWLADRSSTVYVYGMDGDGQLILVDKLPPRRPLEKRRIP